MSLMDGMFICLLFAAGGVFAFMSVFLVVVSIISMIYKKMIGFGIGSLLAGPYCAFVAFKLISAGLLCMA